MNHKTDMQALAERLRLLLSGDAMLAKTDFARATIEQAIAALAGQSAGVPEGEYKRMFEDAVRSLAAIDEALGIDHDEAGGAAPILEAIAELKYRAAPAPVSESADMPEGCTPADAEMLRAANHALAAEIDRLRRRLRPFAQLASSPLSWAMVEYCIKDDPEKQTLQAPQMQRAFNRAADALREDASPSRECGERGHPLSDFERVVLEYVAFNDGFINTRIRARQMLDGVGGERQGAALSDALRAKRDEYEAKRQAEENPNLERIYLGMRDAFEISALLVDKAASAPTLGQAVEQTADRERWKRALSFAKGIISRLDTTEVMRSSVSGIAYDAAERAVFIRNLATEALAAPVVVQPQAAEPKGMTEEQIEKAALDFVKKPGMQGYVEPGDLIDFARALLANGE